MKPVTDMSPADLVNELRALESSKGPESPAFHIQRFEIACVDCDAVIKRGELGRTYLKGANAGFVACVKCGGREYLEWALPTTNRIWELAGEIHRREMAKVCVR